MLHSFTAVSGTTCEPALGFIEIPKSHQREMTAQPPPLLLLFTQDLRAKPER